MDSLIAHADPWPATVGPLDAYRLLAAEYDRVEHRTTRILETLSRQGLERARELALDDHIDRILEVGAGTGALTGALLDTWPSAHLLASDPSPEMLTVLTDKLGTLDGRLSIERLEASRVGDLHQAAPDLIVAGLADPFLDAMTLAAFRAISSASTRLLLTVPSRRWAARERTGRLGIPVGATRFRLGDKSTVFARSLTYDEQALGELLGDASFVPIATGTERSQETWTQPEVCWAVATPL